MSCSAHLEGDSARHSIVVVAKNHSHLSVVSPMSDEALVESVDQYSSKSDNAWCHHTQQQGDLGVSLTKNIQSERHC
jgi:hypothetical protein